MTYQSPEEKEKCCFCISYPVAVAIIGVFTLLDMLLTLALAELDKRGGEPDLFFSLYSMFTRTLIACLFVVLCCSRCNRISRAVLYVSFIIVTCLDFIVFTSLTIIFHTTDQDQKECSEMAKN